MTRTPTRNRWRLGRLEDSKVTTHPQSTYGLPSQHCMYVCPGQSLDRFSMNASESDPPWKTFQPSKVDSPHRSRLFSSRGDTDNGQRSWRRRASRGVKSPLPLPAGGGVSAVGAVLDVGSWPTFSKVSDRNIRHERSLGSRCPREARRSPSPPLPGRVVAS